MHRQILQTPAQLLQATAHRPWPLPAGRWTYYQEWNRALFLHWRIPSEVLQPFVPAGVTLDVFNGFAWVSLVAFTMEKIRPRFLPSLSFISHFHEANLRTYVQADGKAGVYFLSIEAQKPLSAYVARAMSGLPYVPARMHRRYEPVHEYHVHNQPANQLLHTAFSPGPPLPEKSSLDIFLTERYCLYLQKDNRWFRYEIHHLPWELHSVDMISLDLQYRLGTFRLNAHPDLMHYSGGVQVIAWPRSRITGRP